jgi:hypothetical protein
MIAGRSRTVWCKDGAAGGVVQKERGACGCDRVRRVWRVLQKQAKGTEERDGNETESRGAGGSGVGAWGPGDSVLRCFSVSVVSRNGGAVSRRSGMESKSGDMGVAAQKRGQ